MDGFGFDVFDMKFDVKICFESVGVRFELSIDVVMNVQNGLQS